MTTFRISVDVKSVQAGLNAMIDKGSHLHTVFKHLRPELRADLKSHAAREASPEGGWKPRAASTMAAKRFSTVREKRGRSASVEVQGPMQTTATGKPKRRRKVRGESMQGPLREERKAREIGPPLGRLPGGVSTKATARSLIAESPVPWGGVHNEGGRVGRGAMIPAREFVFLSESFLKQAERDLIQFVISGWET